MESQFVFTEEDRLMEELGKDTFTEQMNELDKEITEIQETNEKFMVYEDNKFNYFAQQQDYIEEANVKLEQLIKEKKDYVTSIGIVQKQLVTSFAHIKPQQPLQKENLRSVNLDLGVCLDLNDHVMLLSYLGHLDAQEFIQNQIETKVLLQLIYQLNKCLSTKQITLKVTYILLALNKLLTVKLPSKYKDLIQDVKENFLNFDELFNHPDLHSSVLFILYDCQTIIDSLQQ